jgi:hypothetical protein
MQMGEGVARCHTKFESQPAPLVGVVVTATETVQRLVRSVHCAQLLFCSSLGQLLLQACAGHLCQFALCTPLLCTDVSSLHVVRLCVFTGQWNARLVMHVCTNHPASLVLALSMLQPYCCADMWCAMCCCVFVQVWCDQLPGNLDLHRMMVIPQAGEVRGQRGVAGMESGRRGKHGRRKCRM